MVSRVATLPVRDGNNAIIVPVPPVSLYAYYPVAGEGGTTANRPVSPTPRQAYYDTDLQEEIFYSVERTRWESYMGDSRA